MKPVRRNRKVKVVETTKLVYLPYDVWSVAHDESGMSFAEWRAELPPNFFLDLPF
jgi:hypothetical protein